MSYEFFGEKIIFPSAPAPGINNDQSLMISKPQIHALLIQSFEMISER